MSTSNSKSGKCSNFGNCSLADSRATVQVPTGMDFVCTECAKPLLMSDMGDSRAGGSNKMVLIGAAVGALVLAAGAAWFFLGRSKPVPPPPPPPPAVLAPAPTPAPAPAPVVAPTPTPPEPPITGHCSDVDAKAGLCRKAQ